MKKYYYSSFKALVGIAVLAICLAAGQGLAEVVYEAGFNGVFDGIGGAYDLTTTGGTLIMNSSANGQVNSEFSKDSPMAGGGGYFSCVAISTNFSSGWMDTVTLKPSSALNSLDAMTSVVGGDRVINGGIDFFFRSNKDILGEEMRAFDSDNRGNGGLRFTLGSFLSGTTPGLRLEIISNTDGLLSGGENGSAASVLAIIGAFPMVSNTVYHLGLTFATDAEGTVTAKLWGQEGTGAIDLTSATPVATLTFGINENVVTSGFQAGDFILNQLRPANIKAPITLDYDQLRIYNATPSFFSALGDFPWRDSVAQTVLQADFRGADCGTGGRSDIVTLGGTGTLIYNGTSSVVSVSNTDPFRIGSSGYLSVLTTQDPLWYVLGVASITPSSYGSSLAAMSVVTNGQRLLRGGLDFFFRTDHSVTTCNEFRPIDTDNRGSDGLRLVLHSVSEVNNMELEIIANPDGLYVGKEGGTLAEKFAASFSMPMVSNTVYHVGISFDSTEDGTATVAVWLKEGTGVIDLRAEMPICAVSFGINEAIVKNGFTDGAFNFGKLRIEGYVPTRQDFDVLRIYNDTPVIFSELPVPPLGTTVTIR